MYRMRSGLMMFGAAMLGLLSAGSARAATSITYVGSQQVGDILANYTITTDGTISDYVYSNSIISFVINFSGPNGTYLLDNNNGFAFGYFSADPLRLYQEIPAPLRFESGTIEMSTNTAYLEFRPNFTSAYFLPTSEEDSYTSFYPNTAGFAVLAPVVAPPPAAVPEPATWAMMIVGFGLVGGTMRRRRSAISTRVTHAA